MDHDTRELLRPSLRAVLAEPSDAPLDVRLAELGWAEVVADDAVAALTILFQVKGEVLSPADALGPLLAMTVAAAGGTAQPPSATVVLPASLAAAPVASIADGSIDVDGIALRAPNTGALIVPVAIDGATRLALCEGKVRTAAIAGIEPELGLVSVTGSVRETDVTWADGAVWDAVVAAGRWAIAIELAAIAGQVVLNAVEYTRERHQYGRPIGSFQALQHRLASAHACVLGAENVAQEAARTGEGWAALVAKYLAGRAAEDACTQAQQCYGAIGFTWEHPFHRSLRRVYLLDRLFGGWRELEVEIGETLRRTGVVPKIGRL